MIFFVQPPLLLRKALAAAGNTRAARIVFRVVAGIVLFPLAIVVWTALYITLNRSDLPNLAGFVRFEPPTMGHVYDANGHVLIELGLERRNISRYEEIPEVVRNAVLSAEDKNFFSHSGVDYSVFPRLVTKTNLRAMLAHFTPFHGDDGSHRPPVFPHGGSTLTQQLVRGYFLQKLSSAQNSNTLLHQGVVPRVLAMLMGAPGANKLLLKIEVMRLSLWIEEEMRKQYGSKRLAKEELFARYASFVYLGSGRYGFAAAAEYYFQKPVETFTVDDADKAALLAGITKWPGAYTPTLENVDKPTRRRNQILDLMVTNRFLTAQAARRFKGAPFRLAAHVHEPVEAPAAVQAILAELKQLGSSTGLEIGMAQLLEGRIHVHTTVDRRIQRIADAALENGLKAYEQRHPQSKGMIQGSVVVLRNSDSSILAEIGGREMYQGRLNTHSDLNRVTQSKRQPGSAMKPIVYLAAFRHGALDLETFIPDEPIAVAGGNGRTDKWIANLDNQFEGMIPAREALAKSRNAAAVWVATEIGIEAVLRTAQSVGIRTRLQPYVSTALGASEVTLLELANAYRLMAGGLPGEPRVIDRIQQSRGRVIYQYRRTCCMTGASDWGMSLIQEGLRGAVRIPSGSAHALNARAFPIPVMGKTGTTNNYRDALFVGSTFGPGGITVAVRIGFDDNRTLGARETGARAALPVFREIILKIYRDNLVGPAPRFPAAIEENIDAYLRADLPAKVPAELENPPGVTGLLDAGINDCPAQQGLPPTVPCAFSGHRKNTIYPGKNHRGRRVYVNQ